MAQKLLIEVEEALRDFCAERSIPVSAIRFFGSRSNDAALHENSDLDLLLVSEAFENKDIFERTSMVSGLHRKLVRRFKMPFDIVYCSNKEWLSRNSLLLHALRQAK